MKHIVCQRRLWDVKPYALSLVFLFFGPLFKFVSGPLEKGSRISNEWYSPGIYSFDKIFAIEFCLE